MRKANKLTPLKVKSATQPGLYGDGDGLYLQVSSFGTKAWVYRFMRDGVARKMGLGPVRTVPLSDARQRAALARRALLDDVDPIEARKARRTSARLERARVVTFKECAEKYIAAHEAGWRNAKHREQWRHTLSSYAYPILGDLSVAAIDTGLVLKVLEPIWGSKPETGSRLRGRIESVLNWATTREYRAGENPARWRGHLKNVLPGRSKLKNTQHHAALPYADLPGFMTTLRELNSVAARALEFTILTAARTGETMGARWAEIDIGGKIWTVPASRMKGAREHRVPLCHRALEILAALPREGDLVFPGAKAHMPLADRNMLAVLRGATGDRLTVHGFRSTFRDWAAERTNYANQVIEMALAHAIGDKVEAAYRRGDLFEKRRRLMAEWAKYCSNVAVSATSVTSLRAKANA